MTKKMLIDSSHAEETRVVVLDGNRLEDFDVETAGRKQIKGNIYLAKVIRVEPSLQAAFVEYGGNRHGFLAFGEIHPDYYQIPVADRERLLALQAEEEEAEAQPEPAEEAEATQSAKPLEIRPIKIMDGVPEDEAALFEPQDYLVEAAPIEEQSAEFGEPQVTAEVAPPAPVHAEPEAVTPKHQAEAATAEAPEEENKVAPPHDHQAHNHDTPDTLPTPEMQADEVISGGVFDPTNIETVEDAESEQESTPELPPPENLGGDGDDDAEARERRQRQRFLRQYKIQEVIHRRQIMLIQVVKEERGSKGAALTTYLSLAGRFSVLMPNSPSGGGVSRKITSVTDRRRLKEAVAELDVPQGMGMIVRTAGANQPKPEIKRDCEYLLRLWDDIRERTLESSAPALIYEEASLIKRAIRDVYTRDIEEILVDGQDGFCAARDFMQMLMPAQARKVQLWQEGQPLFAKHQVEAQLDAMLHPTVQLRSGGYIVINQTEALVAIDVNSGRSTRERNIEDTALRTNLEAAEEVAKQLRMRDLAGLIVIDFIDMESRKNNVAVERRLKDALKNDRARIQIGSISHFGLMEMSRQRLRPSLTEASLMQCPHCAGQGHVRSPESATLHILRAIEDEGAKFRAAEINVALPAEIAFYLFNNKRERLQSIEARYLMRVVFTPDSALTGTNFRIEKIKAQTALPPSTPPALQAGQAYVPTREAAPVEEIAEEAAEETVAPDGATAKETAEDGERKRRRRRRRGKRRPEQNNAGAVGDANAEGEGSDETDEEDADGAESEDADVAVTVSASSEHAEGPVAAEVEAPPAPRRGRAPRERRPEQRAPAPEPAFANVADIFEAAERAEEERSRSRAAAVIVPEAEAQTVMAETVTDIVAAEPEAAAASSPASTAPLVKPVVIGATDGTVEKKRGWWRR